MSQYYVTSNKKKENNEWVLFKGRMLTTLLGNRKESICRIKDGRQDCMKVLTTRERQNF